MQSVLYSLPSDSEYQACRLLSRVYPAIVDPGMQSVLYSLPSDIEYTGYIAFCTVYGVIVNTKHAERLV